MKKNIVVSIKIIISVVLLICCVVVSMPLLFSLLSKGDTISVANIGGVDGPTAIYYAPSFWTFLPSAACAIVIFIIALFLLRSVVRRRH